MRYFTALLFITLLPATVVQAQSNPFAPIGREVPLLTLTKGQYPEVFTNDTLRTVCGMVYNRVTAQVVGFVETDTVYTESGMKPELVSRWLSMDPLAAKYPFASPYSFGLDNPVFYIDVGGKEVFVFGSHAQQTVSEIQKKTSLQLTYDAQTNQVTAVGEPITQFDRELLAAISDPKIRVQLFTTDQTSFIAQDGQKLDIVVGGYDGSKNTTKQVVHPPEHGNASTLDGLAKPVTEDVPVVETTQYFNYDQSKQVEAGGLSTVGTDASHEVLESYFGAQQDPGGAYDPVKWKLVHDKALSIDPEAKPVSTLRDGSSGKVIGVGDANGDNPVFFKPSKP